jgi:hypothetical protein
MMRRSFSLLDDDCDGPIDERPAVLDRLGLALGGWCPAISSGSVPGRDTDELAVGLEIDAVDVVVVQQLEAFRARPVGEQGGKPDDGPRAETRVVQQLAERLPDVRVIGTAFRLADLAAFRVSAYWSAIAVGTAKWCPDRMRCFAGTLG